MENNLVTLQKQNNDLTREECLALLRRLKKENLDPILGLLTGEGGASVSFAEIIGGYSAIEKGFKSQSRGAKDVCAQVFYEFHPVSIDCQTAVCSLISTWEYQVLHCNGHHPAFVNCFLQHLQLSSIKFCFCFFYDRQTDSLYFSTMIIKAMQLMGSS